MTKQDRETWASYSRLVLAELERLEEESVDHRAELAALRNGYGELAVKIESLEKAIDQRDARARWAIGVAIPALLTLAGAAIAALQ